MIVTHRHLFDWLVMTAQPTNALSAIAACLLSASEDTGLPIATLGCSPVAASILPDLLPHLSIRPDSISSPYDTDKQDGSPSRIVLCIPPHHAMLSPDEEASCRALCDTLRIKLPRLTNWLYAAVALYSAGVGGKAVVLMPQTSLSRSAWRMGQQDFIDRRLIEAIVALPVTITAVADDPQQPPQYRLGTAAYDTLVILSHPESRPEPNRITFVLPYEIGLFTSKDSNSNSAEMSVAYGDVIDNGYLLTPLRYRENHLLFSDSVRLGDVATITRGIPKARLRELRSLTVSSLGGLEPTSDGSTPVAYLTSKDFEHGYDYCYLAQTGARPSSLYFTAQDIKNVGITPFTEDGVLLSRTGIPFKACRLGCTSFAHQARAYLIADNLYRIQPSSDLDTDYLLAFFSSTPGQQALSRTANSSTTMQQISPNDLRDMFIPLPPVEQQHDIAARYQNQLDRIADIERQRADLVAERDGWFPVAL